MRIEEYFQQLEALLALFPHVALKTMRYDQRSETKGFVRGIIHFADRSELHVREFVDVSAGIDRFKYSYHYMREGHMIFRYDNAADITAKDFATYPHHKHDGEVIQASHAPTYPQQQPPVRAGCRPPFRHTESQDYCVRHG